MTVSLLNNLFAISSDLIMRSVRGRPGLQKYLINATGGGYGFPKEYQLKFYNLAFQS